MAPAWMVLVLTWDAAQAETLRRISEIADGGVVLSEPVMGAASARLAGVQLPLAGNPGAKAWPLADAASKALESLVRGKTVRLDPTAEGPDRHGRLAAHVFLEDGTWIQGEMLRLGLARVRTRPDENRRARDMLAIEDGARKGRIGIWGHPFYAVRGPLGLERFVGTFQVVEGTVVDAALVKGRAYLNFGADWRDDFTVSIAPRNLKRFAEAGLDPLAAKGRLVRVRGWLESRNGPMIAATHPEQLELTGVGHEDER